MVFSKLTQQVCRRDVRNVIVGQTLSSRDATIRLYRYLPSEPSCKMDFWFVRSGADVDMNTPLLLQEADSDEDSGHEEDQRANNPHEDSSEALVIERRKVERVRLLQVVAVDGTVTEGKECRERCIHDVRSDQVGNHVPAWVAFARRPRADERPPEQDRGSKKADMLELVPVLMLKGKVIGGGYVPTEEYEIHRHPRNQRHCNDMTDCSQRLPSEQRPKHRSQQAARNAAE